MLVVFFLDMYAKIDILISSKVKNMSLRSILWIIKILKDLIAGL